MIPSVISHFCANLAVPFASGNSKILAFERVATFAMGFPFIRVPFAACDVYFLWNDLNMIWIATRTRFAQVVSNKVAWYFAFKDLVRNAMNARDFFVPPSLSVAIAKKRTQPQPATSIWLDVDFISNVFREET